MQLIEVYKTDIDNQLLAIKYDGNDTDELTRIFDDWYDVEFLYKFLEANQQDLEEAFQRKITIEEAVEEISSEVGMLEEQLLDRFTKGKMQELFAPLNNNEYVIELQESKGKIKARSFRRPKVRIYAIRIAPNVFIITGGAIKLTNAMQDRPHTRMELIKIRKVKQWLRQNGCEFPEDLNDL
ncbi:hypothetical protein [Chitinophaga sp. sic0106]|uniref:hypothetical protein n=1 Tax=Chitinophaga sp. sic0106 TaxID=2854785 RepID=UPI001C489488|nr:hypothetical protein [Chitinophaga sp. sic0106]MBV7532157.1 hypothetical protein [Chitinophaga sp. sic0106]